MNENELLGMKRLAMAYGDPIRGHILTLIATIEIQKDLLVEKDRLIESMTEDE